MTTDNTQPSDGEADELVRRAMVWIGEFVQEGAHRCATGAGAELLVKFAEIELLTIRKKVFGDPETGETADPVVRDLMLRELRRNHPESLEQLKRKRAQT